MHPMIDKIVRAKVDLGYVKAGQVYRVIGTRQSHPNECRYVFPGIPGSFQDSCFDLYVPQMVPVGEALIVKRDTKSRICACGIDRLDCTYHKD